jgi:hypothetical protein
VALSKFQVGPSGRASRHAIALPLGPTGKVDKATLRAELQP